jgi:hypothetical protein
MVCLDEKRGKWREGNTNILVHYLKETLDHLNKSSYKLKGKKGKGGRKRDKKGEINRTKASGGTNRRIHTEAETV